MLSTQTSQESCSSSCPPPFASSLHLGSYSHLLSPSVFTIASSPCIDGWLHAWRDGWMDRCMDGWTHRSIDPPRSSMSSGCCPTTLLPLHPNVSKYMPIYYPTSKSVCSSLSSLDLGLHYPLGFPETVSEQGGKHTSGSVLPLRDMTSHQCGPGFCAARGLAALNLPCYSPPQGIFGVLTATWETLWRWHDLLTLRGCSLLALR